MPRFVIGASAAMILVAALAACSSSSPSSSGPNSAAAGAAGPQQNRVLVDGQDQGAIEHVRCGPYNDGVGIKVGMGHHGVNLLLINGNPPKVQNVHFQDFLLSGGAEADADLDYEAGQNNGSAAATQQGNTYKITGAATSSKPSEHTVKSFEIDVTCP